MKPLTNAKHEAFAQATRYVYTLTDPRDGSIFYVGKGSGSRAWEHERRVKRRGRAESSKEGRILDILSAGLLVSVAIMSRHQTDAEACAAEKTLIADIGLANLTNMNRGGSPGGRPGALGSARGLARIALDHLSRFKPFPETRDPIVAMQIWDHLVEVLKTSGAKLVPAGAREAFCREVDKLFPSSTDVLRGELEIIQA